MRRGIVAALIAVSSAVAVLGAPPPDARRGKQIFLQCAACHNMDGRPSLGPDLRGVVGSKSAARTDYRYSAAMNRSNIIWDEVALDAYVANPQQFMRGTKMPYAGMKDARDRADLIAYLKTVR